MITIEALLPEHFEIVANWLSRPEINRWLTGEWRDRVANPSILAIALRNRRNRMFLVRSNTVPCGLVGLADIDSADQTAMIWYLLGEDRFLGQGVTSEAVQQTARFAFSEMKLASLYAWAMQDNVASCRVLQRVGFRECGHIRNAANSGGRQVDRVYFDLTAEDCDQTSL
jgi:RimJ/RimL family protein N-acetyltransferase